MIARVQRLLSASGFPAGRADGIAGEKTLAAWSEYLQTLDLSGRWPDGRRDASLDAFFGPKGANLCRIQLPYPMRLSWALDIRVTSISCHELVAGSLLRALHSLFDHVGGDLDQLRFYGLDIFGGCYSLRKMRGGSRWSRHSWGIAIDLDPE
ncbi:MAG: M15 family peptidase, partial [Acidobacteriota bacterium]